MPHAKPRVSVAGRLERLDFIWDPNDATWDEMFTALGAYKKVHGDCNVPVNWEENPRLGNWCSFQRQLYRSNRLSPDRVKRLEAIGFRIAVRQSKKR